MTVERKKKGEIHMIYYTPKNSQMLIKFNRVLIMTKILITYSVYPQFVNIVRLNYNNGQI